MNLVSVVIPSYNAAAHIRETLASVLSQQGVELEVLLLDDASTDATLEIARSFRDPRLRIFGSPFNLGRVGNVNRSFDLARGEYVARIDHDDIAAPGRLAKQAAHLDSHPQVTVVGSQLQMFGLQSGGSDFPLEDGRIKARFIAGAAYLANPSTMFRNSFIQRHGLRFDPNHYIVDDLGLWFDCMLRGARFANLPEALTQYRIHERMTSMNLHVERLYQAKRRLYARLLPVYFPRLTGRDVAAILPVYAMFEPSGDFQELVRMHRAAGVAVSEVDPALGVDEAEAKESLVQLVNYHRAKWLAKGMLSETQVAELDGIFYGAQG